MNSLTYEQSQRDEFNRIEAKYEKCNCKMLEEKKTNDPKRKASINS